jgi:hypothetical protein
MNLLKKQPWVLLLGLFLALAVVIGGPAFVAFADSVTGVTLSIGAGTLTESAPATVTASGVTLDGTDKTSTYALPLTVIDATGSFAGWHLSVTSSQFTDGTHTLAATASTISAAPSVVCVTGVTCTAPNNNISYASPLTVPAGSVGSEPSAVPFYNAAVGSGIGAFTITPTVSIAIPANTHAGNYSSNVNVTIAAGP